MKKWYEVQLVIVVVLNVLALTIWVCGEVISGKRFLYSTETFTILIGLLVVSGIVGLLGNWYLDNKKTRT